MEELITIIVPIYKVEKYISRCIDSLIAQTYKNLQIILVDDGSPDNSGEICEEYAKKDNRIEVYHKENGGLSDARNFGVRYAKGEYVTFIDSDDYISLIYIAYLYRILKENGCDVSCCNYMKTSDDYCEFDEDGEIAVFNNGSDACCGMFTEYHFMTIACASLYKLDIVRNNPFPLNRLQEDEATTYKYYYDSNKTVVSTARLYGYYQNKNGIMATKSRKNFDDLLTSLLERYSYFSIRDFKCQMYSLSALCRHIIFGVKKKYLKINNEYKGYLKENLKNNYSSKKLKTFIRVYLIFGNLALVFLKNK